MNIDSNVVSNNITVNTKSQDEQKDPTYPTPLLKSLRHSSTDSGVDVDVYSSETLGRIPQKEGFKLLFPNYNCNIYEDLVVLKLAVRNVDKSSMKKEAISFQEGAGFSLRFQAKGSDSASLSYGFDLIYLYDNQKILTYSLDDLEVEIWDNNIIAKAALPSTASRSYKVGNGSVGYKVFTLPQLQIYKQRKNFMQNPVQRLEGSAVLTVPDSESVSTTSSCNINEETSKLSQSYGILKKPLQFSRGQSCSDFLSDRFHLMSLTSLSSCQSESSSISGFGSGTKKSVRFNEVVRRQIFRTNSSILGRCLKNRKKSEQKKRRAIERRMSEGDTRDLNSHSPGNRQKVRWECSNHPKAQSLDSSDGLKIEPLRLEKPRKHDSVIHGALPEMGKSNSTNLDLIFDFDP